MDSGEYTAKHIMVLSGTQGIRKRPAMYIGSTGSQGFLHLLYEVLDNAVDEAMAGYCRNITVTITNEDGVDVAEVSDDGRGIPVDVLPKEGKPALEVIMTSLHSGGKFNNEAYKVSGGLHGVGLTVVNSLSEYTVVTVRRGGKAYRMQFSRGQVTSPLEVIGDAQESERGTTVRFKPDTEIFSTKAFDTISLTERLKDVAYLTPGLTIKFINAREGDEKRETVFKSERGIADFLDHIRDKAEPLTKPVTLNKQANGITISAAFQYANTYTEDLYSFVNKIRTGEGGTHVVGFHTALTRAITNYISKNKQKIGVEIEGSDTREGLVAIVSILMPNPEFEGQTKEKLGNTEIKNHVDNAVYSFLSTYLEENPAEAAKIITKVANAAQARESAKKARDLARKKSLFEGSVLPGKLADCTETDPEKTELFIVEGESAAGSSKQGRDRFYQAILPLKGKILNVEKASEEKIFNNAELHSLVTALGAGIKESFSPQNLRYNKIILLTDADVDGSHIRTLLLTFFYRYMRALIDQGHIYIAQPPLYKVSKGRDNKYVYSDAEMEAALKERGGQATIQRYKGLGEMNPEQLWETTMEPNNRILKRVSVRDAERANSIFTVLMGMDVQQRRQFLEEHSSEVSFLDV
ncbi:MAG: DNA gyrase subunit B [Candidatus Micrarchaeota archaeon]|nr:DNA gyrase subunit B [Candidatus Micrarchaeota archaeon]